MKIKTDSVRKSKGPISFGGVVSKSAELLDGYALARDAEVKGEISAGADGSLRITARVTGELVCVCDRCLCTFYAPLDAALAESVSKADFFAEWQEEFDGAEFVRQGLLAAKSVRVLCKEGCKGLCPQCGANRNETTCECSLG